MGPVLWQLQTKIWTLVVNSCLVVPMQLTLSDIKTTGLKKWIVVQLEQQLIHLQSPEFSAWVHRKLPTQIRPLLMALAPALGQKFVERNLSYALDWLQPELVRYKFEISDMSLNRIEFSLSANPKLQKFKPAILVQAIETSLKTLFEQHLHGSQTSMDLTSIRFVPNPKMIERQIASSSAQVTIKAVIEFDESSLDLALYGLQRNGSVELDGQAQYKVTSKEAATDSKISGQIVFSIQLGMGLELSHGASKKTKSKTKASD